MTVHPRDFAICPGMADYSVVASDFHIRNAESTSRIYDLHPKCAVGGDMCVGPIGNWVEQDHERLQQQQPNDIAFH